MAKYCIKLVNGQVIQVDNLTKEQAIASLNELLAKIEQGILVKREKTNEIFELSGDMAIEFNSKNPQEEDDYERMKQELNAESPKEIDWRDIHEGK
jgi:geranylgeranyl pyrophosphate synthase